MNDTRFCTTCRHRVPGDFTEEASQRKYARCQQETVVAWHQRGGRPMAEYLASGGDPQLPYCSAGRLDHSPCGPDGKLYEPKEVST